MLAKDQTCYAFIQLPGTFEWTVCGVLKVSEVGTKAYRGVFQYGRSYLARQNVPSLDPYKLPLSDRPQEFTKLKGVPGATQAPTPGA
jgi:serine/threonine-protein kinase HipA